MVTSVRGLAAVALILTAAGLAKAGWGWSWFQKGCSGDGCSGCDAPAAKAEYVTIPGQGRQGWHPFLKKCGFCDPARQAEPQKMAPPPAPPGQAGGTLVFPNHPYARSPRDYFMED